jgi:hypothetical protein
LSTLGWLAQARELAGKRIVTSFPVIKSSFLIALICTRSRRFPESASPNQGPEKDDVILF